jgi:hypothetical protein
VVILESLDMQMLEAQYHRVHSMVGLQYIIDITLDCLNEFPNLDSNHR